MEVNNNLLEPLPAETSPQKKNGVVSGSRLNSKDMKLKRACTDFEGILLNYMFEAMRKTVGEGGVFKKSFQKDMYESMFTQEVSNTLSRGKGVGLGEVLYRQLSGRTKEGSVKSSGALEKSVSQEKEAANRYK
jgi:Rod binding domain-containing protein